MMVELSSTPLTDADEARLFLGERVVARRETWKDVVSIRLAGSLKFGSGRGFLDTDGDAGYCCAALIGKCPADPPDVNLAIALYSREN